jgi:hypothetical protein
MDPEYHYIMDETHSYIFREQKTRHRIHVVQEYAKVLTGLINERFSLNPAINDEEISELIFMAFRDNENENDDTKWISLHNLIGEYCFTYAYLREKGLPSFSFKNNPVEIMNVEGFCNPYKIKMLNEEE